MFLVGTGDNWSKDDDDDDDREDEVEESVETVDSIFINDDVGVTRAFSDLVRDGVAGVSVVAFVDSDDGAESIFFGAETIFFTAVVVMCLCSLIDDSNAVSSVLPLLLFDTMVLRFLLMILMALTLIYSSYR